MSKANKQKGQQPTKVFMQAGLTFRSISSNNAIQLLFRLT
jgi:hypothetical protein